MWKCPICESNNDDQNRICHVCGSKIDVPGTNVILGEENEPGTPSGRRFDSDDDAYTPVPHPNTVKMSSVPTAPISGKRKSPAAA